MPPGRPAGGMAWSTRFERNRAVHQPNQPGQPHSGDGEHAPGRSHNPLVAYELSGTVRWVEPDERFVLLVEDTNSHAGGFRGQDVTVDASDGRVDLEVLPGLKVAVTTRLPRELEGAPPALIAAHSVRAA